MCSSSSSFFIAVIFVHKCKRAKSKRDWNLCIIIWTDRHFCLYTLTFMTREKATAVSPIKSCRNDLNICRIQISNTFWNFSFHDLTLILLPLSHYSLLQQSLFALFKMSNAWKGLMNLVRMTMYFTRRTFK